MAKTGLKVPSVPASRVPGAVVTGRSLISKDCFQPNVALLKLLVPLQTKTHIGRLQSEAQEKKSAAEEEFICVGHSEGTLPIFHSMNSTSQSPK